MEIKTEPNVPRASRIWLALTMAVVLLGVTAVWQSAHMSQSMSVAASDDPLSAQNPSGAKTKVVLEVIEATSKNVIRGKLLQKKTEEIYLRTGTSVIVQFDEGTKLVMGKKPDIHPGAIIHVSGTTRDDHSILAEQLVILTGYVQIQ